MLGRQPYLFEIRIMATRINRLSSMPGPGKDRGTFRWGSLTIFFVLSVYLGKRSSRMPLRVQVREVNGGPMGPQEPFRSQVLTIQ